MIKPSRNDNVLLRLHRFPQLHCGFYPTPIEEMPRLRAAMGKACPRLFIKRDDFTGAGFGGNKVRKLDYVLAKAKADGAEVVITIGGEKSNHARVTASLCARLGLACDLVLSPAALSYEGVKPASIHVDELVGARVHRVATRDERLPMMRNLADHYAGQGIRVFQIPLGASIPLGALGFVQAMKELQKQMQALSLPLNFIFHSSSSGGTQAGLIAGAQLLGLKDTRVIGVSPDDPAPSIAGEVKAIVRGINDLLELPPGTLKEDATVLDEYVGEGYGITTKESEAALQLVAKVEGIVLDPVYTAKAMAALLDWIQCGRFSADDAVLFLHTGGQLALFYSPL